jgi:hypothetical protein
MRFAVKRTSVYDENQQPIEEAVEGTTDYWDVRTFKSEEEHDERFGHREKWRDQGTDHQTVYGPRGGVQGIKRKLGPHKAWFIEIDTLEEFMALYGKYGPIVISGALGDESVPCIEIYDDYRE